MCEEKAVLFAPRHRLYSVGEIFMFGVEQDRRQRGQGHKTMGTISQGVAQPPVGCGERRIWGWPVGGELAFSPSTQWGGATPSMTSACHKSGTTHQHPRQQWGRSNFPLGSEIAKIAEKSSVASPCLQP